MLIFYLSCFGIIRNQQLNSLLPARQQQKALHTPPIFPDTEEQTNKTPFKALEKKGGV